MTQIIRSGAFLQQCWSVHPLCIQVKRIGEDRTLVLTCTSCKSTHHLLVGLIAPRELAGHPGTADMAAGGAQGGEAMLRACLAGHQAALTLREMDVFEDLVLLRCANCRRHYEVTVSAFETHQR